MTPPRRGSASRRAASITPRVPDAFPSCVAMGSSTDRCTDGRAARWPTAPPHAASPSSALRPPPSDPVRSRVTRQRDAASLTGRLPRRRLLRTGSCRTTSSCPRTDPRSRPRLGGCSPCSGTSCRRAAGGSVARPCPDGRLRRYPGQVPGLGRRHAVRNLWPLRGLLLRRGVCVEGQFCDDLEPCTTYTDCQAGEVCQKCLPPGARPLSGPVAARLTHPSHRCNADRVRPPDPGRVVAVVAVLRPLLSASGVAPPDASIHGVVHSRRVAGGGLRTDAAAGRDADPCPTIGPPGRGPRRCRAGCPGHTGRRTGTACGARWPAARAGSPAGAAGAAAG